MTKRRSKIDGGTYLSAYSARVTTRLGAHRAFSLGRSGPSSLDSGGLWSSRHGDY